MNWLRSPSAALVIIMMLALLSGCTWPTFDPAKIRAIKAEAHSLIADYPTEPPHAWAQHVPRSKWPPVIAGLKPDSVTVYQWGVDISVKPFFDGGWGYQIGRKSTLPMPAGCYWELGKGVFWHDPC